MQTNPKSVALKSARQTARPARRRGCHAEQGQALLELTLVTPLLFMLIVVAIDFGGWLYAWAQVGNATRAVANYSALGLSSAGAPVTPGAGAITALLQNDLASLPNYSVSNPAVAVCWNQNGTVSTISGTCASPPADPEAASFIAISVDLTYTHTSLLSAFDIPALGIHIPTLPTSIHRRVVMRYL